MPQRELKVSSRLWHPFDTRGVKHSSWRSWHPQRSYAMRYFQFARTLTLTRNEAGFLSKQNNLFSKVFIEKYLVVSVLGETRKDCLFAPAYCNVKTRASLIWARLAHINVTSLVESPNKDQLGSSLRWDKREIGDRKADW